MANKKASGKKASNKSSRSDENVVRIKASSSSPKKEKAVVTESATATSTTTAKPKVKRAKKGGPKVFRAIIGYFTGAWYELRQVRWPNRRATWSLTGAVLVYSLFFVVLVLLLDAFFKYLFELILGK